MSSNNPATGLRYQVDEKPPFAVSMVLGLQLAALNATATILLTTVILRAAGQPEAYLAWVVFAAMVIGGAASMLQTRRLGRFGMGNVLMVSTAGAFIAVNIDALVKGGPGLLATLVVVSALVQFVIAARLSVFRRILTPAVSGTVLMLVPVSMLAPILDLLTHVPDGAPVAGGPLSALATVLVFCALTLRMEGPLRLWASFIGVLAGSIVAAFFGLYDATRVGEATWFGLPPLEWPGLDLEFGPAFWSLLPGFLLAAMVASIRTISSAVVAQNVSRPRRAVDLRSVQGAVATLGLSNLLAGLAGTTPNSTLSTGSAMTQLTGVASRHVGLFAGAIFLSMAFSPKLLAVVLAIPGPVFAAFVVVMMGSLFMGGAQMAFQDGMDYRKSLIVGVSFWLGVSFQSGQVFPEFFSEFAGGLMNNGMTAGGLVAILLTLFVDLTQPRPRRFVAPLASPSLPGLQRFLNEFAARSGWAGAMTERLNAVSEEVLLTLLGEVEGAEDAPRRRLILLARKEGARAVLEFMATTEERGNLQDQIALLSERGRESLVEQEMSLRLLRHLAASIRHQQYHNVDIITVHVDVPKPGAPG